MTTTTTTCSDVQDQLIDYRFGELDPPARRAVAAHLAECGACAVAYCRLDADVAGIGAALHEEPPAHVHAALKARVEAEFRPPLLRRVRAFLNRRIPVYQGALATAGVIAAVLLVTPSPPASPPLPASAPAVDLTAHDAPEVRELLDDYDASSVPALDPYLL